jgi:hypothetical protein
MEGYKKILLIHQPIGIGEPAIFAPEAECFEDPLRWAAPDPPKPLRLEVGPAQMPAGGSVPATSK